jgi:hypothetical protein
MNLKQLLESTVSALDDCVQQLSRSFPLPSRVSRGDGFAFRHGSQTDLLLSYMKAVRIASAHNASIVLMRSGFIQETYSLCRTIDEACEDIWFMSTPLGEGGQPSEDQRRFIDEFFQEEFENPGDLLSSAKRDRVPRKKIRAALTRIPGAESKNPSHELAVVRTLDQTFSGFVHGPYVHIMEMFGGNPPRFHTRGMLGTPRIGECERNHVNYLYRSLLAIELVARRADREDITTRLCNISIDLAEKTGAATPEGLESAKRRRARGFVSPA